MRLDIFKNQLFLYLLIVYIFIPILSFSENPEDYIRTWFILGPINAKEINVSYIKNEGSLNISENDSSEVIINSSKENKK